MSVARCPLIVANWKLHGDAAFVATYAGALKRLLAHAAGVDVAVCPPAVYLPQVRDLLSGTDVALGAQNVSDRRQGTYTGEISAYMLKDIGCEYVIVGHSERRRLYHEDNALIARKFVAALEAELTPILCVGETLEQRKAGEARQVVAAQLAVVSDAVGGFSNGLSWVVAYEPVWAIGTGYSASVDQAVKMHHAISAHLAVSGLTRFPRVVYGGSIKPDNASALLQADGVDGGLVGGASLDAESFCRICTAGSDG